jgi:hypothetical protein
MILTIVQHTPLWVWGLLAGLVALGLAQTRDRAMSLPRILLTPAVMLALSLAGVLGAFGGRPMALAAWSSGLGLALLFGRHAVKPHGARWSDAQRRVQVPGSWLPLALIVALFAIKYLAGVALAMAPGLAADAAFAGGCSLAYGVFSGLFLARALSLCMLARRTVAAAAVALVRHPAGGPPSALR